MKTKMKTLGDQTKEQVAALMRRKVNPIQSFIMVVVGFGLFIGVLYVGSLFSSDPTAKQIQVLRTQEASITQQLTTLSDQHGTFERERKKRQDALDYTVGEMKKLEESAIPLKEERTRIIREISRLQRGDSEKSISLLPEAQADELTDQTTAEPEQTFQKPKELDLDKLAHAVSMAETAGCTAGYGVEYNNCFGIKNGNTAPCKRIGRNRMCIYESKEESFVAFKKIWSTWYKEFPDRALASKWTGADRVDTWLRSVQQYYGA